MPGLSEVLDSLKLTGLFRADLRVDAEPFVTREYLAATGLPIGTGSSSTALFQVPESENWIVYGFSAQIDQNAGAVAITGVTFRAGPAGFDRLRLPFFRENATVRGIDYGLTLNAVNAYILEIPPCGLQLPPNGGITYNQTAGDGTITGVIQMYFLRLQTNQLIRF